MCVVCSVYSECECVQCVCVREKEENVVCSSVCAKWLANKHTTS